VTVRPADFDILPFDGDVAAWNARVAAWRGTSFAHLAEWAALIEDVLGHECLYRVAVDDGGQVHGALPLVRIRSRLFGHHLVSMPYVSYGGPAGSPAACLCLARWALEEARRSRADVCLLRTRAALDAGAPSVVRKVTVLFDLPDSVESLWAGFPAKLRSQIRRPQKEGMVVRFGASEAEAFYEVFARHMRDLGTPVLPRAWFLGIAARFPTHATFGTVYYGTQPVAAGCGFLWRDEFEITWAAALRKFNRYAPNMLLYYAFLERMTRAGVRVFNFGRCTPGRGTHRFKRQWGGRDEPLPWVEASPRGRATPSPDDPSYGLAIRVWQRLPLAVTNRVGPWLARQLPG
jgi:serine/alanine adding enzyme